MAYYPSRVGETPIETVDISLFITETSDSLADLERLRSGQALVRALHNLGFVKVAGHGIEKHEIETAFAWTKKLFDLPYEDKMRAPHPPSSMPHRGYSGIGKEKVYSPADVEANGAVANPAKALRKISDFKESYEIGSEDDPVQQNIWLPDDILPDFRRRMADLYKRMCGVSEALLQAICVGLGLNDEERTALDRLISYRHCQLRLLHYPAISKDRLQNDLIARLPSHTDWGTFTILFQDGGGGLELKNPQSQEYLHAEPEDETIILNIGDMLQRFTNDYFISASHRVSIPKADRVPETGIPARYSIPFFTTPDFTHVVETLPRFVTTETPCKYEPVRFDEYGASVSKYQYEGNDS
ncbi:Clavaminate synthase-like protein [Daldinia decipiens]|uniref:Clavaminate synthase-like protein n=1 Tax=Daldinia decipiens TaxID=326647 RepID=UPI0020C1E1FF|nr:Clavaminate synthase-like protein [Daldinia decipiens]KAI1653339.1 Clavaminate synthase-like protein [Daldinia decipiens]